MLKIMFPNAQFTEGADPNKLLAWARKSDHLEIKKAVETLFKVKVSAVRTANLPGKLHKVGRYEGYRSDWKKAVVTVKAGQKIDMTDLPK